MFLNHLRKERKRALLALEIERYEGNLMGDLISAERVVRSRSYLLISSPYYSFWLQYLYLFSVFEGGP